MAREPGPYVPPVGFSLTYQGGHHDVYCNGAEHIWTSGGFTGLSERQFKNRGKCDCAHWKTNEESLMNMEITEALAVVAAKNLSPEIAAKIGAAAPSQALYDAALDVISKEAARSDGFHMQFGDLSGDNS